MLPEDDGAGAGGGKGRRGGGENHEETPHTAVNTTSLTEVPGRVSRRTARRSYLCTRTHAQISFFTCLGCLYICVCVRTPACIPAHADARFLTCERARVSRVNWCGVFFASCPFMWKVCCAGECECLPYSFPTTCLRAHIHEARFLTRARVELAQRVSEPLCARVAVSVSLSVYPTFF